MENKSNSFLFFPLLFFPSLLPLLSCKLTSLEINGTNEAQSYPVRAQFLLLCPPQRLYLEMLQEPLSIYTELGYHMPKYLRQFRLL